MYAGNRLLTGLVLVTGIGLALFYQVRVAGSDAPFRNLSVAAISREPAWKPVFPMDSGSWFVFQASSDSPGFPTSSGSLGNRFRLAGTYFSFTDDKGDSGSFRRAILDDSATADQKLVKEGDRLEPGDIRVDRIESDHVILISGLDSVKIFLGSPDLDEVFAAPAMLRASPVSGIRDAPLEVTAYGERVAEDRWEIRRDALMAYYAELRDDPERIALLYQSFKPVYLEGRITGYRLEIEGEKEFLEAMGLLENDVIRMVNSMDMTSQRRAEHFIREFVQGRVDTFELEFQREGLLRRQIYQIR